MLMLGAVIVVAWLILVSPNLPGLGVEPGAVQPTSTSTSMFNDHLPYRQERESIRQESSSGSVGAVPTQPLQASMVKAVPAVAPLRISAFSIDGNGFRHEVSGRAILTIRHYDGPPVLGENGSLPREWVDLRPGSYSVYLATSGYRPLKTNISVVAQSSNDHQLRLEALPVRVSFQLPDDASKVSVYDGSSSLGAVASVLELAPYVVHHMKFTAYGWRDWQQDFKFDSPGATYKTRVPLERVSAGLRIITSAEGGENAPTLAYISVDGGVPREIELPFERWEVVPPSYPVTVVLWIEGYDIPNRTQQVKLVDRELASVTFEIKRRSWISRVFGDDTKPPIRSF